VKPTDDVRRIRHGWRDRPRCLEERLCDIAAAEMLTPRDAMKKYAGQAILSKLFQVSPLMIAVRMMEIEELPPPDVLYRRFDRQAFMERQFARGKPVVIMWMPSTKRMECRQHLDVYGMSDLLGIKEVPTLFSAAGQRQHRVFMIPYLITGYDVPASMEEDGLRMELRWRKE